MQSAPDQFRVDDGNSAQGSKAGDVVLLHGCCHNPTGADLTNAQWDEITEIALERGFIPFIDTAYQGLG